MAELADQLSQANGKPLLVKFSVSVVKRGTKSATQVDETETDPTLLLQSGSDLKQQFGIRDNGISIQDLRAEVAVKSADWSAVDGFPEQFERLWLCHAER